MPFQATHPANLAPRAAAAMPTADVSDWTAPTDARDRLWELSSNRHCSIIGTCLSTADLRGVLGEPEARSQDAAGTVKRCCREANKRFVPLRSASLAGMLSVIAAL